MSDGGPEQPKLKVDRLARAMAAARVRAQTGEPPSASTPPASARPSAPMASPPSAPDPAVERPPGPEAPEQPVASLALALPAACGSPAPEVPEASVATAVPAPGRLLLTPDQMRIPPAQPPQSAEPPEPTSAPAAAEPSQPVAGRAALSHRWRLAGEDPSVPETASGWDPTPPGAVAASDAPARSGRGPFSAAAAASDRTQLAEQGLPAAPTAGGSNPAPPTAPTVAASAPPARDGQGLSSAAAAVPSDPPELAEEGRPPTQIAAGLDQAPAASDRSQLAGQDLPAPSIVGGSDPAPPAGPAVAASELALRAGQGLFSTAASGPSDLPDLAEEGRLPAPTAAAGSDQAPPGGPEAAASEPPAPAGQGLYSATTAVPSDPPELVEQDLRTAPTAAGSDQAAAGGAEAAASEPAARGGQRLFAAAATVAPEPLRPAAPHPPAATPEPSPLRKPALPALLSLTDVRTDIGRYHVLEGIGFEVPARGVTMLLGRNGAGKTTTLRTIMGLWRAKAGRIRLGGLDIAGWPPHRIARQGVGYVPEDMGIFGALTVAENMRLAATAGPIPQDRLDAIFRIFPALRTFWNGAAGNLSGGQKQMLALARAMVEKRQLYLIDEPTKGLAPAIVATLTAALRELKLQGATILMVEQNLAVARALGDTCVVMDDGKVAWRGPMTVFAEDEALQARLLGLDLERP